jgi:FixJ family two-component response regulator
MDKPAWISIVDDDPSVRRALGRLCKLEGYHVESFESAEDFLESTSVDKTECLILDIHLPGRNGVELQQELHATGRRFPVVFVTAFESDDLRTRVLACGAADFLQKPLDNDLLLDVIRHALHQ